MDIKNHALVRHQNFIGGEWVDSNNQDSTEIFNPANSDLLGSVPSSGKIETLNAIKAAN